MFWNETIKCPVCGEDMERGNLRSTGGNGLFYIPDASEMSDWGIWTRGAVEKRNGIVLDGPYMTRLNSTSVRCFACRKCKKIIIDY